MRFMKNLMITFSLISGETKVFKSDLLGAKQGVYDLNTNNTYKIKYILSKSDYILIPTQVDYKDLIKRLLL